MRQDNTQTCPKRVLSFLKNLKLILNSFILISNSFHHRVEGYSKKSRSIVILTNSFQI